MSQVVVWIICVFGIGLETSLRADTTSPGISSLVARDWDGQHCLAANAGGTLTSKAALLDLTDDLDGMSTGEGKK